MSAVPPECDCDRVVVGVRAVAAPVAGGFHIPTVHHMVDMEIKPVGMIGNGWAAPGVGKCVAEIIAA